MHGYTYIVKNNGSNESPNYAEPEKIMTESVPADVYGMPSPCMEDFDGDGDLDLICGEFLDSFTWFENIGSRKISPHKPPWRWRNPEETEMSAPWRTTPVIKDIDKDGVTDLVILDHEGYLAFFKGEMKEGRKIVLPIGTMTERKTYLLIANPV